jgi:hypothetical protein
LIGHEQPRPGGRGRRAPFAAAECSVRAHRHYQRPGGCHIRHIHQQEEHMRHHDSMGISFNPMALLRTLVLGTAVVAALATPSFAQSYDPDVGSGNIVRSYGGYRHFGRINPAWRASVHHRHGRHHRLRHR